MVIAGDHATVTVKDNGVGIPADAAERSGSHGLKQMKFRMQAIRGTCEVAAAPDGGTIAIIRFPMSTNMRSKAGVW
jgi:signal transduction histidine kinase